MQFSDAMERVLAAGSRAELIEAVAAGAGDVAASGGVRVAELRMAPEIAYRVVAHRRPAPDPTPAIVRSPMDHPIVATYVETRFVDWVSIQDLLPGRAWLDHPLYREVYRPLGLRAHIAGALRDRGAVMLALALNRAGRDYTHRERERLEDYRRFVGTAWRLLDERLAARVALEIADGDAGRAVLVLTPDPGTPRRVHCSAEMSRLLLLDPALMDTIRQLTQSGDTAAPVLSSGRAVRLSVTRRRDAVVVRADQVGDPRLTSREQEVLSALAGGGTAHAIGHELGISERTVRKHLENIYAKVGVHDRLQAVLRAGSAEG